jgi:TolB-like protein
LRLRRCALRLARFLRFTVEAVLEERGDELKERTIGVEVYGRRFDYEPRRDPIVRSEAHRLRSRLAAYYAREGSADPIVVKYPKGSYVPELRPNTKEPAQGVGDCRLIVAGLTDAGGGAADEASAMGTALRTRLARRPGLRVMGQVAGGRGRPRGDHLAADYRLEGTLERGDRHCTVRARVVRLADERQVWSGRERFASARAHEAEDALAAAIGAALTNCARPPVRPSVARARDLYVSGRHSVMQDRREIARAFCDALQGRPEEARRVLNAHHSEGPHFWDHLIRVALALGEEGLAAELVRSNPINANYRWLAREPLVRAYLRRPRWRALAEELHASWLRASPATSAAIRLPTISASRIPVTTENDRRCSARTRTDRSRIP